MPYRITACAPMGRAGREQHHHHQPRRRVLRSRPVRNDRQRERPGLGFTVAQGGPRKPVHTPRARRLSRESGHSGFAAGRVSQGLMPGGAPGTPWGHGFARFLACLLR